MTPSLWENRPGESVRQLFLRLPATDVSKSDFATFDAERFVAALKRSHVGAIAIVAPLPLNAPNVNSESGAPDSRDGDLRSRLLAACRAQGMAVEEASWTGTEIEIARNAFASRPALEAACYHRLIRGGPIALEDCLDPSGTFDAETYRLLGSVLGEVAFKEPWCRGAQRQVEIGIVSPTEKPTESVVGALRILQAGGHAFDLLQASADFTQYRLLILPEDAVEKHILNSTLNANLAAYLAQGGRLLAAFESSSEAEKAASVLNASGREAQSEPENLRSGHTVLLSQPHFRAYAQSAGTRHKRAVLEALNLLLPDPLLRHDGPGTLEATVTEQAEYNRWILHLMHYLPMGFALDSPVRDEILPVQEVKISLKTPKPVVRVDLRPHHHDALDFWEHQGRVEFVVPKITGHRMVSIEFAK